MAPEIVHRPCLDTSIRKGCICEYLSHILVVSGADGTASIPLTSFWHPETSNMDLLLVTEACKT